MDNGKSSFCHGHLGAFWFRATEEGEAGVQPGGAFSNSLALPVLFQTNKWLLVKHALAQPTAGFKLKQKDSCFAFNKSITIPFNIQSIANN